MTSPGLSAPAPRRRWWRSPRFWFFGLLQSHGGLTPDEAASVVETRQRLGRLTSVDELVVHGRLSLVTADRLRELAVFLH